MNKTITLSDGGFPNPFTGTPEDFKNAFLQYLVAEINDDNLILGSTSDTQPVDGAANPLWLDHGSLKYWNGSAYVPVYVELGNSSHVTQLLAGTLTGDRTVTFQDKSGIVAYLADVYTPRLTTVLVGGATNNVDWSLTNAFFLSLSANTVMTEVNSLPGQNIAIAITNGAGLSYTVTWDGVIFPSGAPTQSVLGKTDLYVLRNLAGTIYGEHLVDMKV